MTVAARLRKLEAQATPGPWRVVAEHECGRDVFQGVTAGRTADVWGDGHGTVFSTLRYRQERKHDAALIVTARNLLPLLADLAEAAEERDAPLVPPVSVGTVARRQERLFAALARVAAQLDHEEGTT